MQAVELKFPRNGQHPEQMFSFCKDIAFLEQLVEVGFGKGFFLGFADDPLFYEGQSQGIYAYFRNGLTLTGEIKKPTGTQNKTITIRGSYEIEWRPVCGNFKYMLLEVS